MEIVDLVDELKKYNEVKIIVVNDGSLEEKDKIFDFIKTYVILLKHDKNLGKGAAIKTALKYVKEHIGDCTIITMDADG